MPLPLYGSGLRTPRISAANWPTFCLSASDNDGRRIGELHGHAFRRVHLDRVGITDGKHDRLLVHAGLIADAFNLETLFEALGDTFDHVSNEAAGQAVESAVLPFIVGPGYRDGLSLFIVGDLHVAVIDLFKLALGPLDAHRAVGDAGLDAARDHDGLFANT